MALMNDFLHTCGANSFPRPLQRSICYALPDSTPSYLHTTNILATLPSTGLPWHPLAQKSSPTRRRPNEKRRGLTMVSMAGILDGPCTIIATTRSTFLPQKVPDIAPPLVSHPRNSNSLKHHIKTELLRLWMTSNMNFIIQHQPHIPFPEATQPTMPSENS